MLVPLIMIIFGGIMRKKSPKKINMWYGYRTDRSMKNMQTWDFAHKYFGVRWWRIGLSMLPVSAAVAALTYGAGETVMCLCMLGVLVLQMLLLIHSIFKTEAALKNEFNDDGAPKSTSDKATDI